MQVNVTRKKTKAAERGVAEGNRRGDVHHAAMWAVYVNGHHVGHYRAGYGGGSWSAGTSAVWYPTEYGKTVGLNHVDAYGGWKNVRERVERRVVRNAMQALGAATVKTVEAVTE